MIARRTLVAAVLALAACQTAPAAETPAALRGDYFVLNSQALGRPLHIHVSLPENYASETRTYPTVYLTDGDSLFPMLVPTHLFLSYDEPVPPAIIVGIAYGTFGEGNMRRVDYTAPGPDLPGANADVYQRFLAEELIPEIERRFRSNEARRVLVGQSRGASFVVYSAITAPDLFWGRIASNPAFDFNRDVYFGPPAASVRSDLSLFVASGSRDRPNLRSGALEWFEHWNARPQRPWRLNTVTIDGGTHAADMGEVYSEAMVWLFRDEPR